MSALLSQKGCPDMSGSYCARLLRGMQSVILVSDFDWTLSYDYYLQNPSRSLWATNLRKLLDAKW